MVEVAIHVSRHAKPLHDPARPFIVDDGKSDDLLEPQPVKPVFERGACSLGRVAAPPIRPGETPRDLNGGRERYRPV